MYDYAIVGAGINGTSMAYFLSLAGKKVLLIDKEGIASGGSGAAGAFLSPKIGKGGPLQTLINHAYNFTVPFYKKHFPELLTQRGLLHMPKSTMDAAEHFSHYKSVIHQDDDFFPEEILDPLCEKNLGREGIFFADAGIIEPDSLCKKLAYRSDLLIEEVRDLRFTGSSWRLNDDTVEARHIILASGVSTLSLYDAYFALRPVWGERIEIVSNEKISINYHQNISVSATKPNGHIVIGATHEQHTAQSSLKEKSAQKLLDEAKKLLCLSTTKIVDQRGGARSGSTDYFPLAGPLVDASETLKQFPQLAKGAKIDPSRFSYLPQLSVLNGAGGRGFVLAPYLAHQLCHHLLNNCELDTAILPARLFIRWAKKHRTAPKELT